MSPMVAPSAPKPLSSAIRDAREAAQLSLRAAAIRAGMSASHLSDIENDRRRPSVEVLDAIADALSVSKRKLRAIACIDCPMCAPFRRPL